MYELWENSKGDLLTGKSFKYYLVKEAEHIQVNTTSQAVFDDISSEENKINDTTELSLNSEQTDYHEVENYHVKNQDVKKKKSQYK